MFCDWLAHLIFQELDDRGHWTVELFADTTFFATKNKVIQVMIMTLPISDSLLITKTQDKLLPILWRLVERRHSYDAAFRL